MAFSLFSVKLRCFELNMPRQHSQVRFISHEPLASGLLNTTFNGAGGGLAPWDSQLQNSVASVNLLVDRLKSDFEGLSVKMRRPYGLKDVESQIVGKSLFNACF